MRGFLMMLTFAVLVASASEIYGQYASWVDEGMTINVDVSQPWTTSGIYVSTGDTLTILAKGTYSPWGAGQNHWFSWSGPAGTIPDGGSGSSGPLVGWPGGCAIGRIGASDPFYVGEFVNLVAESSGELSFGINDATTGDNRGTLVIFVIAPSPDDVVGVLGPGSGEEALPVTPATAKITAVSPNPFNPTTVIHFDISEPADVKVSVHDVRGRLMAVLSDTFLHPGGYSSTWDGMDSRGRRAASGTYIVSLSQNGRIVQEKATLVK